MESAADGCLATTDASGVQPLWRFFGKRRTRAPSVFYAFLGAICERPLNHHCFLHYESDEIQLMNAVCVDREHIKENTTL